MKDIKIGAFVLFLLFVVTNAFLLCEWGSTFGTFSSSSILDADLASKFGNFYGGVYGSIFGGLVAGLAVYAAYKAFRQSKKDSIATKFYEMLDMHQKDIDDLKKNDPQIFERYLKLIAVIYNIIDRTPKLEQYTDKEKLRLAYLLFFYGTSENLYEHFNQSATNNKDGNNIKRDIDSIKSIINNHLTNYNGYYHEFGIYFRQLYQTVKYIDEQVYLSYAEKYGYIKNLRARLNIHEQYLLFINSLVGSGKGWERLSKESIQTFLSNRGRQVIDNKAPSKEQIEKCWITKYNLIKNIPCETPLIGGIEFRDIYSFVEYEGDGENNTRVELKKTMKWKE